MCRCEPTPNYVLLPVNTWRCWSKTRSGLLATFRTAAYAMRVNTSQGRIDNGHAGRGHFAQAGAEEPAVPDLRCSAVHEVTGVGAQSLSP